MSMQGSTLRILEAALFTPPQALALAEAIESEIKGAELVTVPVIDVRFAAIDARFAAVDGRFAELRQEMARMETRLTNKMMGLGIAVSGIIVSAMLFLLKK